MIIHDVKYKTCVAQLEDTYHDMHDAVQSIDIAEAGAAQRFYKLRDMDENNDVKSITAAEIEIMINQERGIASFSKRRVYFEGASGLMFPDNIEETPFIGWEGKLTEDNLIAMFRPMFLTKQQPFTTEQEKKEGCCECRCIS